MGTLSGRAKRTGRWIRAQWRAIRHPAGWYDEIDTVYGTETKPSGRTSSGAAGLGMISSGGGGGA
jgi:hypothetical protein